MKKKCEMCDAPFESKRRDARFCSGKCRIASVRGKPKFDVNAEARAVLAKRVPVAKPVVESRVPAPNLLSRLTVKLPSADNRVPVPAKKKAQPKGGSDYETA